MSKENDYIKNISEEAERRFFVAPVTMEKRAEGEEDRPGKIEGMAALFNKRTMIGNWFEEEVLPGAFDDVLNDDVRCLFNHSPNLVLARSVNGKGTLELSVTDKGLKYAYVTPERSYAKDLEDAIETGDVSNSSFSFKIKEQKWISREGEVDLRQIVKFEKLYDVSPVTYPAYADATVAKRSHDAFVAENTDVNDPKQIDNKEKRASSLDEFEAQHMFNLNKK